MKDSKPAKYFILLIIVGLAYYVFASYTSLSNLFYNNDEAYYVCLAKSLTQGEGYRSIYDADTPLHAKYPPVFSILLSLIWRIYPSFPENIFLLRQFSVFAGLGIIFLFYLTLKKWINSHLLICLTLVLFASNSRFLTFSNFIQAEILYIFVQLFLFFKIEEYIRVKKPTNKRLMASIIVLSLMLFYIRNIGIAAIVCIPTILFLRKDFKKAVYFSLFTLPLIFAWLVYVKTSGESSYFDEFLFYARDPVLFFNIITRNIKEVFLYSVPLNIFPTLCSKTILQLVDKFNVTPLYAAFCMIFSLFTFWGGYVFIRKNKLYFLGCYILIYVLIASIWHWETSRMIFVLLPFLLIFFITACQKIFKKTWAIILIFVIILAGNLKRDTHILYDMRLYGNPTGKYTAQEWEKFLPLFEWVKKKTNEDEVIATSYRPLYYLYTGRKTIDYIYAEGQDLNFYKKNNVKFLVRSSYNHTWEPGDVEGLRLKQLENKYPGRVKQVYKTSDPEYGVYKIIH